MGNPNIWGTELEGYHEENLITNHKAKKKNNRTNNMHVLGKGHLKKLSLIVSPLTE